MNRMRIDIEAVVDLDAAWPELKSMFLAFEDYNSGFLKRRLRDDWEQRWHDHLALHDDRLVLMARYGEHAVGYLAASVQRDSGLFDEVVAHISNVFIRREYRSDGLGRRMLRRADEWARGRGAEAIQLEVFTANKPAVRFWTLSGFGLDMLAMKKGLRSEGGG